MLNEIIKLFKDIINSSLIFIIIDIILATVMSITGILTFNKKRKISYLIFVFTSLIIYLNMIFRILEILEVFMIKEILISGIPLFYYLINFLISFFFALGFVFLLIEKK